MEVVEASTVCDRQMEASIEHEGTMFNNKARLQVSYGKKVIVVDAQMDSKSDVSGKVMISTPSWFTLKIISSVYSVLMDPRISMRSLVITVKSASAILPLIVTSP
jgi:hypothetical protein